MAQSMLSPLLHPQQAQSHDLLPSQGKGTLALSCLCSCPGTSGKLNRALDTATGQGLTVPTALGLEWHALAKRPSVPGAKLSAYLRLSEQAQTVLRPSISQDNCCAWGARPHLPYKSCMVDCAWVTPLQVRKNSHPRSGLSILAREDAQKAGIYKRQE